MATELASLVLRMSADSAQLRTDMRKIRRSTADMERGFSRASRNIRAAVQAIAVGKLVQETARAADTYRLLSARIGLVVKDEKALQAVEKRLFDTAQDTRQSYQGVAELYARLSRNTQNLAVSQEDLLKITKLVGQSILISGTNAQEAYGGLIQFSQGLASGELRGEELRSVMENIPGLADAIVKGLDAIGVTANGTIGDLREMSRAGELTAEVILKALLTQVDRLEREFSSIPLTVSQAMTQLANDVQRGVAKSDMSPLIESIGELREVVSDPATIKSFTHLFSVMTEGAALVVKGWGEIFRVIKAGLKELDNITGRAFQSMPERFQADIAKARAELDKLSSQQIEDQKELDLLAARREQRRNVVTPLIDETPIFEGALQERIQARQRRIEELRSQVAELDKLRARAIANEEAMNKNADELGKVDLSIKNQVVPKIVVDEEGTKAAETRAKQIQSIIASLKTEAETYGMTSEEIALYNLRNLEAGDTLIKLAAGYIDKINLLKQEEEALEASSKAAKEAEEANRLARLEDQKLIETLAEEIELMQLGERERAQERAVRQLSAQAMDEQREAVRKLAGELYDLQDAAEEAAFSIEEFAREGARDIQDALGDKLFNFMQGKFDDIVDSFKQMIDRMVADAASAKLGEALTGSFTSGGSLGGFFGSIFPGIARAFDGGATTNAAAAGVGAGGLDAAIGSFLTAGLASGGPALPGNMYLVGEEGPELFAPGVAGRVIPNDAMPNGVVVNINVSGVRDDGHLRQSASQVAAQAAVALQRASRRNN